MLREGLVPSSHISGLLLGIESVIPELSVSTGWGNWNIVDLVTLFIHLIYHLHLRVLKERIVVGPIKALCSCLFLFKEHVTKPFTLLARDKVIPQKVVDEVFTNCKFNLLV